MPTKDDWDVQTQQHQRERTFRQRRNSFINSNDLPLHPHYHSELNSNPHVYPDRHQQSEVKYMTPQERARTQKSMANGQVANHALEGLDGQKDLRGNRNVIFTRRGSVPDLMMMEKHTVNQNNVNLPFLKSNHSSFNQGKSVANAGFLRFDNLRKLTKVILSSGHYGPTHESGVKLAMWAEKTKAFNPQNVPIVDHQGTRVDISHNKRVETVNNWAANHPVPVRQRRNSL